MPKPKVYVAGPYTDGDTAINVRVAFQTADDLAKRGFVPHVPHGKHFWHLLFPHEKDFWMEQDREWLLTCDAVLRIPGYSEGADTKVALAKANGIQVFESLHDLQVSLRQPDL